MSSDTNFLHCGHSSRSSTLSIFCRHRLWNVCWHGNILHVSSNISRHTGHSKKLYSKTISPTSVILEIVYWRKNKRYKSEGNEQRGKPKPWMIWPKHNCSQCWILHSAHPWWITYPWIEIYFRSLLRNHISFKMKRKWLEPSKYSKLEPNRIDELFNTTITKPKK